MKTLFVCLALSLCFMQCSSSELAPTFAEQRAKALTDLIPKLTGTWELTQLQINHRELGYFDAPPGITKDTLLPYLATLTLQPASRADQRQPPRPDISELEGTVLFRGKTFPIYGQLITAPSHQPSQTEFRGYITMQYNLALPPLSPVPSEQTYLRGIGLVSDTFEIELTSTKTAIWRGLGRAIVSTTLQKK